MCWCHSWSCWGCLSKQLRTNIGMAASCNRRAPLRVAATLQGSQPGGTSACRLGHCWSGQHGSVMIRVARHPHNAGSARCCWIDNDGVWACNCWCVHCSGTSNHSPTRRAVALLPYFGQCKLRRASQLLLATNSVLRSNATGDKRAVWLEE